MARSNYVYFVSRSEKEPTIVRVQISGHKVEQVVSLKGFHQEWGGFGPWLDLTPDHSPLLVLSTGMQDIYGLELEAP